MPACLNERVIGRQLSIAALDTRVTGRGWSGARVSVGMPVIPVGLRGRNADRHGIGDARHWWRLWCNLQLERRMLRMAGNIGRRCGLDADSGSEILLDLCHRAAAYQFPDVWRGSMAISKKYAICWKSSSEL